MVAAAWSPAGAPPSWQLTAAQFELLRDDRELQAIAARIPSDRLPPLLFQAAASFLVLELEPPLRRMFPRVGQPQPQLCQSFKSEYRAFCLEHRDRLLDLCASHRYQMNEVGRCAGLVPALAAAADGTQEIALVDVGTGAGLALHLDRYRYRYHGAGVNLTEIGDASSPVLIETRLRGTATPPIPRSLPTVATRIGIDIEPLDIGDPAVLAWLAACIPQEIGAVARFHDAVEVACAHPARMIRGDACEALPEALASIPADQLVCLTDSYVHVFFEPAELERFRTLIGDAGIDRDLDWVSIDPLVPMGSTGSDSVLGVPAPPGLQARNRREGVFGVIGRLSYRGGRRSAALLGLAHPGAAWLEWLAPAAARR